MSSHVIYRFKNTQFSTFSHGSAKPFSDRQTEEMEQLMAEETRNRTWVREFVLEGFPVAEHLRILFFLMHLLAYLASIMGNTLIISITCVDHRLQTPMYFFLSTYSFVECCFITTVIPQLLAIFLSGRQTISFVACFTQALVVFVLGATVFFPPGCLIPGPLSGHLQTSTLSNHHEPKDVLSPCYCVLSFGIPLHGWSSCDAFPVILLWPQCYSSLFLWFWATGKSLLFRYHVCWDAVF